MKVTRKKDQSLIISGSNSLTGAGEAYSSSVLCPRLCRRLWASLKQKVTNKERGEQERRQQQGTNDRKRLGAERGRYVCCDKGAVASKSGSVHFDPKSRVKLAAQSPAGVNSDGDEGRTVREEVKEKNRRKENMEDIEVKKEEGPLVLSLLENLPRIP